MPSWYIAGNERFRGAAFSVPAASAVNFSISPWNTEQGFTAYAVASAPDGGFTANSLTEDTTAANTHDVHQTIVIAGGTSLIVYMKSGSRTWGTIQINTAVPFTAATAYFDLNGGVTGSIQDLVSTGAIASSAIAAAGGGWYRCTATIGSVASADIYFGAATGDLGRSYDGNGSLSLYLWALSVP
jgi:hypothetical protein